MYYFRSHRGFSLIEILIVVAIIAILGSIVISSLSTAREQARNRAVMAQMLEYQKALEFFFVQSGYYPATNSARTARYCMGDNPPSGGRCIGTITSTYDTDDSEINRALREEMSLLPRFSQPRGGFNYSSPAYSGCAGEGMSNTSCTEEDYSFWYLLEGTNKECGGRATVANNSVSGEYTLCRLSSK
jgi:prepilin-type N-terminal cleavage/methylation domain-containing protein